MGIQGLLQALKPYVEPVHVSKYSGQRVGIDAYSWLHKGAYGCSWQQLRETDIRQGSGRLQPYVMYCMHRIRMLLFNGITPVVVFDGGRLPLKALTEQNRRRGRQENLHKAEQKLAEGDVLSAQDHFQKAIEITPAMAYELIKVLRDERVEYVVAPYEADAQLAHLSTLAPEEGGISLIITEDSDLLAYGCKAVLFKMDKFGNGEELSMDRILQGCPPPATGMSFRNFTQDLFLAMCVLAGCDFLASIPGIGVKKAHALLVKYRNIHRVLNKLKISKHNEFPEDYITNFWQAKAIFKHARVYEKKSRSLILLNPLPDELLKEFGGDTEFLGPDLPQSRARAIAIGQLDPTTMCSFDVLPNRTATPFALFNNSDHEFMQAQKEKLSRIPKMDLPQPFRIDFFEHSNASCGPGTQSLQTLAGCMPEMRMEPGVSQTGSVMSGSAPKVDQKTLADFELTRSSDSCRRTEDDAVPFQMGGQDTRQHRMPSDTPRNNPFRSLPDGLTLLCPEISSQEQEEFKGSSVALSSETLIFSIFDSVEDSQQLLSSRELTSIHTKTTSLVTPELEVADCTTFDRTQVTESLARVKRLDCSNCADSQNSSISVLTDISPNIVAVSPADEYDIARSPSDALQYDTARTPSSAPQNDIARTPSSAPQNDIARTPSSVPRYDTARTPSSASQYDIARTPSSAPSLKTKHPPLESAGKMDPTKSISRLKKSKSASNFDRRSFGGKRSRDRSPQTPSEREGNILRFFKPIPTLTKLSPEY